MAVVIADDEALPLGLGIGILDRPGRREAALGHGKCAMCRRKRMVARFIFQFGRIVASSACGTRVGWKCSQCCTLCSMSSLRSRCVQAADRRKFQRARAAAE